MEIVMLGRGLVSGRVAVMCGLLLSALTWGCKPGVTATAETFRYAKLIEPMIEARDTTRFEELVVEIESAASAGKMTDAEADEIVKIILEAEGGDWDAAKEAAQAVIQAGSR